MSRGMALALSAITGMCAVAGSSRRILQRFDAADAGQIDVHQDDIRPRGARNLDAAVAVHRAQQADFGPPRDELLDQHHIRRVVLDIEQCAQRRVSVRSALDHGRDFGAWTASLALSRRGSSIQNTLPFPTVLSTPMAPPINSTSRLLTTRPMPVPSSALASWPRRLNGWNSCASFSGANPSPVSCDADADALRAHSRCSPRRPFRLPCCI